MGTKTIGLRDDVYERLNARKREGESFTDLVDRLLDEAVPDWREGFGTLPEAEAEELERFVEDSRQGLSAGLTERQADAIAELAGGGEENEDTDDAETP